MNEKIIWLWQNELLPKRYIRFFLHPYEDKASITIRLLTIWVEWCQNICSAASLQEMVHFVKGNSFCIWNFFQLNSLLFITCSFGGGVSTYYFGCVVYKNIINETSFFIKLYSLKCWFWWFRGGVLLNIMKRNIDGVMSTFAKT